MRLSFILLLSFFCKISAFYTNGLLTTKHIQVSSALRVPNMIHMSASGGTYLTQLQKALLARGGAIPPSVSSPPQSFQPPQPTFETSRSTAYQSQGTDANEEEEDNGLPFSDAIYDDMKFVISKLSDRMKHNLILSKSDLARFENSVHSIIRDARRGAGLPVATASAGAAAISRLASISARPVAPPVAPASMAESSETDEAFDKLKGKPSTWHVEGMDNMSTQEYYDALNKRNAAVRAQLKITSGSERNSGDNYLDSLSKKTFESKGGR